MYEDTIIKIALDNELEKLSNEDRSSKNNLNNIQIIEYIAITKFIIRVDFADGCQQANMAIINTNSINV